MAIRIWFTTEDLARTRVAAPDPFAETVFSVVPLRTGGLPGWSRQTRQRLAAPLRPLAGVFPGTAPILDLFSVAGRSDALEDALDRLLGAPHGVLDAEVAYFVHAHGRVPDGLRRLLEPERGVHRALALAVKGYHDVAVGPYWPRLRRHLELERTRAAGLVAEGGFERLFADLHTTGLRWRAPVLEARSTRTREHHLDGRGLLLAPSVFCPFPVLCHDMSGAHQSVLVYPAPLAFAGPRQPWSADRALSGLLGVTRSAVLAAAAGGATTTELARRAGVSLSSASEHARVLREAGLLRTERRGRAVRHSPTDLAVQLLDGHGGR